MTTIHVKFDNLDLAVRRYKRDNSATRILLTRMLRS